MIDPMKEPPEETLDPVDWTDVRALTHKVVDDAIQHLADVRQRPVWRDMPEHVREAYRAPLSKEPMPLREVYQEIAERLLPYSMGNIHPRFWGWYMGASNFTGALGDFLAAQLAN